jgi:4-aminobutyrate aminotransferase
VVQAIQEQATHLIFGQMNIVVPPTTVALAEKLNEVTPAGIDRYFFSNSGAEAVEAAVKLARMATHRRNLIVFQGSFHGRTHQAMAMTTSKYTYRYDYQPLPGGIFVAPFPYSYYFGWSEEETVEFCLKQLDQLLKSQTAPGETAAMIIEPVLGEGGYVPPPMRFMQELAALCKQHGILLIADEVQSGFGRTGKWFGFEHFGITPDIVTMAKGIASGLPLSGLAASAELMSHWPTGSHGGTFGGNAVACAAGVATIAAMHEEGLVENAARQGKVLMAGLRKLQEEHPEIGDVRGLGLMIGTEFTTPDGEPWTERSKAVAKAALAEGLMLLTCGTYDNIIRWIPPLVISESQAKDALGMFEKALKAD